MQVKKKIVKKKAFRMKKEPERPERFMKKQFKKSFLSGRSYNGISAAKVIKALETLSKKEGVALKDIKVDYYYGQATWTGPEPMADYQKRLVAYNHKLEEWQEWAKDYKEEIRDHKKAQALKQAKATATKIKSVRTRQDKLDADLLLLQKKAQEEEQLLYQLSK